MRSFHFPLFVCFAAASAMGLGCGNSSPKTPSTRPLSTSADGEKRFELACSDRLFCEREAARECPHGYDVESELHHDGTSVHRKELESPPPGNAVDDPSVIAGMDPWWGEQPALRLVVRCFAPLD